jgi:hypothetical protein
LRSPHVTLPTMADRHIRAALCALALFWLGISLGCDRIFVVTGVVVEARLALEGSVYDSRKPLSGVEIALYVPRSPRTGTTEPLTLARAVSDERGVYRLRAIGPGRIPDDAFVEFSKAGYRRQRVYPLRKAPAEGVELQACGPDGDVDCKVLNVRLTRE